MSIGRRARFFRPMLAIGVLIMAALLSSCAANLEKLGLERLAGFFESQGPKDWESDRELPEKWSVVSKNMTLLAIDPFNAQVAFAVDLPTGRVLRTDDTGRSWQPLGLSGQGISSFVVAPSDPNLIYAVVDLVKIIVTRDGGKTWSDLPPFPLRSPEGSAPQIKDLTVDPGNPQLILAAVGPASPDEAEGGLYRSHDGGRTWDTPKIPGAPRTWKSGMTSVAFSRINPIVVMAAGEVGVLRSQDAGVTWENVRSGPANGIVSMGRADEKWSWVVANSLIAVTQNGGRSWTPFELRTAAGTAPSLGQIALDSRSPLIAYVPWGSPDFKDGGIFRTTDGGKTWNVLVPPDQNRTVSKLFPSADGALLWVGTKSPDGTRDSIWHLIVR